MDEELFKKTCKRLAVRIARGKDKSLVGSGVILVCEQYNYALIFTAAHVIKELEKMESPQVHFCFTDGDDKQQEKILTIKSGCGEEDSPTGENGMYYIHPDYVSKTTGYPENDAAIIKIPYYEWMSNLSKFSISIPGGEQAFLVGFPQKYDKKFTSAEEFKHTGYRDNIYDEIIKIEASRYNNYVIKNVNPNKYPFGIDSDIVGLSGGGIFSMGQNGLVFNGALVSSKDEGKDTYYATGFQSFIEVLNKYNLKLSIENLQFIVRKSYKRFNGVIDEEALAWFKKNADLFFPKDYNFNLFGGSFVNSDLLNCSSYRKLCDDFYISKMVGVVLIGTVYNIDVGNVNEQTIQIDSFDKPVNIEYICSENSIEQVVSEFLTRKAFSAQGLFKNHSVFVIGSKKDIKDSVSRRRCRRIIGSIVSERSGEFSGSEEFASDVNNLLTNEHRDDRYIPFSIIKGDLIQADIGFVGIGRLEEVMKETQCQEHELEARVKRLMGEIWEA